MQMTRNKTMATFIAIILVASLALGISSLTNVKGANTYPIPGHPSDGYNLATYTAIQQGMYWTGQDANASAARLLFWTRFKDQVNTHVFIITAPTPIGVGQACNVVFFNPQVPLNSGGSIVAGYTLRYFYTFQVTKPDGTVQKFPTATPPSYSAWSQNEFVTFNGQNVFGSDSTGSTYMTYTPDTVGNYTFTVTFVQQQNLYNSTYGVSDDWYGITLLSSTYTTTLVVQQQQVSLTGLPTPSYSAVPTQYWSRPIEQENTIWYSVASNWLADQHDYNNGGSQNAFQADGTAPNSAHVLWTYPEEDSGILGGTDTTRLGNSFNTGSQYQPRMTPPIYGGEGPIIMYGRLYYSPNLYTSGYSELFNCIDLKTGQFVYSVNTTAVTGAANRPAFGYYYSQDDVNEHGIQNPGWLFTSNYGVGYQPEYGYAELHLVNAPSSYEVTGPEGENLRYATANVGTGASPIYYVSQWNSSKVIGMIASGATPSTQNYEANVPIAPARPTTGTYYWNGTAWSTTTITNFTALNVYTAAAVSPSYDWNITMPSQFNNAATGAITIGGVKLGDILWGYNGSWPTGTSAPAYTYPDNVTTWAISLAMTNGVPAGSLLYMNTILTDTSSTNTAGADGSNQNILYEHADPGAGVFVGIEVPSQTYFVWDMHTGNLLFTTDSQSASISPYGYYTWPSLISGTQVKTAYGMLITGGYSGSVSAYFLNSTGNNVNPVWRYEVIPPGTAGVIKSSPGMMAGIAGGIVYIGCHEHSAETPLEAGNQVRAINATTGQPIWSMSGWCYPSTFAVADGILTYLNNYDEQIYAVGQGPTRTTVSAPSSGVTTTGPITISGSVMDISPGTNQAIVKYDFPNGVPAVSEASMGQWMEYVYMQKVKPTNATGVPVSIDAIDSNGNYRHLGTATTDSSGMFSLSWTPDITGSYTVTATFAGSAGYYGSSSEASFAAGAPAATPTTTQTTPVSSNTDTYVIGIGVAIIIVIVIIGAVIMMMLRKRA